MDELKEYMTLADGWVGGKWRAKGTPVMMTARAAQYENVTLQPDAEPKVELTGSLDDPLDKNAGLAEKAATETKKRGRGRK